MNNRNANSDETDGSQSNIEVVSDKGSDIPTDNSHNSNINNGVIFSINDCEIASLEANSTRKIEAILNEETEISQELCKTLDCAIPKLSRELSDYVLEKDGVQYLLYQGKNSIGRRSDNDLVIQGVAGVSRQHATITVSATSIQLTDHSLNGCGVNGAELRNSSVLLKVTDQIHFWRCRFTLKRKLNDKDLLIADVGSESLLVQKFSNYNKNNRLSAGFSLVELLIVLIVIGIISAISIANLVSSRRAANAASAIQSMRVITSSQASYQAGVGNGEFALPFSLLSERYIDESVARACLPTPTNSQAPKSGYIFLFNTTQSDSSADGLASFSVSGRPIVVNSSLRSGDRSFFVDQTGVIKVSSDLLGFADSNSQPLQ